MQHLLRAWRDRSTGFGPILEETAARVLRAIDHLDSTARSFSRFGTAPNTPAAVDAVDVAVVVRDVIALQSLGSDGRTWRSSGADAPVWARARAHEIREVLLNVCDNARIAGAHTIDLALETGGGRVTLTVTDDGEGVPQQVQARVFEPHFSTRTSGSGLGLAISRRLVEGWGGKIDFHSEPGVGTTLRISLEAADAPALSPTHVA